jgi:TatD DNase family protein
MYIDTHCHLDWDSYQEDFIQVMERAKLAKVERVITIGVDEQSNIKTRALTKYDSIYRCVGYHPDIVLKDGFNLDEINRLMIALKDEIAQPKTIGIGECGLDYYCFEGQDLSDDRKGELKELQMELFERQILAAVQNGLPLSLHVRDTGESAYEDVAEKLSEYFSEESDYSARSFEILLPDLTADSEGSAKQVAHEKSVPGVLHCVSGPKWYVQHCLDMGFMVSFAGNVSYKNAQDLVEIADMVPLDRIVIETDGPFLSPVPYRGKRNEPAYVVAVAETLAGIKKVSLSEIEEVTTLNAKGLFGI